MVRVAIDTTRFVSRPYTILAISLAGLLFIWPLLQSVSGVRGDTGGRILFAVILVAGAYANADSRRRMMLVLFLGLPPFALNWFEAVAPGTYNMPELVLSTVFLVYTAGTILLHVLAASRVTADTISGGIAVYFLLAIVFALGFNILETVTPGSFRLPGNVVLPEHTHLSQVDGGVFLYFSIVTLTTVGYGDMVPLSGAARALAGMESTIGQLYLTVLVARLVGLHVTSKPS